MSRPIIVNGHSGAGKSFLVENACRMYPSFKVIPKLSTRRPRKYETLSVPPATRDIVPDTDAATVKQCEFWYEYVDNIYGLSLHSIQEAIANTLTPIFIIRKGEIIQRIIKIFPDALVLYVQGALSGHDLEQMLHLQGRTSDEIRERMGRIKPDLDEYIEYFPLIDYVLVNYYDPTFLRQLVKVLDQDAHRRAAGQSTKAASASLNSTPI